MTKSISELDMQEMSSPVRDYLHQCLPKRTSQKRRVELASLAQIAITMGNSLRTKLPAIHYSPLHDLGYQESEEVKEALEKANKFYEVNPRDIRQELFGF